MLELEPDAQGQTTVSLTTKLELRGLSKLGGLQVGRATRKQLDGALDGLQGLADGWRSAG